MKAESTIIRNISMPPPTFEMGELVESEDLALVVICTHATGSEVAPHFSGTILHSIHRNYKVGDHADGFIKRDFALFRGTLNLTQ